jgi:hypothetical protein
MKPPWEDKTGLARSVAILSTVLLVSTGLCGLNALAYATGGGRHPGLTALFIFTGMAELVGMLVGLLGLLVVVFIWLGREIGWRRSPPWSARRTGRVTPDIPAGPGDARCVPSTPAISNESLRRVNYSTEVPARLPPEADQKED